MDNVATMPRARGWTREPGCDHQATERGFPAVSVAVEHAGALRRMMVATDFSAASAQAVERAAALAEGYGAVLTVLHVIDVNVGPAWGPAGEVIRGLWETAWVEMRRLGSWLDGRVQARGEVEEGLPAEVIVEKSKGYDLLVLGKKPPRRGWKFFARHTAERVARGAACPVIVVEAGAGAVVCAAGKR